MNKMLRQVCTITFAALLLIISGKSTAQTNPSSEADLKKDAAKYFDNEDFANAYPLYSQLLSLYPDNSDYNYRFGTCMLFSKSDKEKPVNYLELAVKDPTIDKLAYYYLGRAYHLNYRFDDAINAYQHFKQIASSSELRKHPVDHLIEMCNNGKTLLKDVHDLDVLVKKELSLGDYFHAYDLSANGGSTLVEPDDFKTKLDKKKQLNSVVYLSPDKNEVFYASYGDNDKNGKDIYEVKRLPTGRFSKPTNLGDVINTPYDEDYPFYDAPTHTLYFCSKGHNSMGGYDVFKSVYDENTNTWGTPVNMDFPISTPDDDILFIADTLGQTAYFASTRSSPEGMIDIYKITIQKHAPATVLLKGIAYSDNGKKPAASTITVKNYETGQTVGIYNSSHEDGSYFMSLPNGSQLVYSVETPGYPTQSKPVMIPKEEELVTLKQEIGYDTASGKLIITNHFQAAGANADYLLALDYIKKKALMDVDTNVPPLPLAKNDTTRPSRQNNTETANVANSTQDNNTGLNQNNNASQQNNNTTVAQNNSNSTPDNNGIQTNSSDGNNTSIAQNNTNGSANTNNPDSLENNTSANTETNISNDQLAKIADNDAMEQQQAAKSAKEDADRATQYANDKMDEAQSLNNEAQQITDNATNIADEQQKKDSLAKATTLRQQANDLTKKAIEAYQIAAQEQTDAKTKEKQAELATKYSSDLDSVAKTKNNKQAIAQLQAEQDNLKKQQENAPVNQVTASDLIGQQAQNTKQDSAEVAHHNDELKQEVNGLQQQSEDYINQAQKTDNAQEKVALLQQAKDLADSKKEKEKEIKNNEKLQQQLHNQYVNQLAQAQTADSITKATAQAGTSSQPSSEDVASIKEEIKNYTPSNQTALAQNNSANNNTSNPLNANSTNTAGANNTANSVNNTENSTNENNTTTLGNNTTLASNSTETSSQQNNPSNNNTSSSGQTTTSGNVNSVNNGSSSSQEVALSQNSGQNQSPGQDNANQTNTSGIESNNQNNNTSTVGDTNKKASSETASANLGSANNASNTNQFSNTNAVSQVVQFNNTSDINNVIPTNSVQYSDPTASTASKNAAQYNTDADSLSSQADAARLDAHNATDNEQARVYSQKADSLDKAAEQKRIQSDETANAAGESQFTSNKQQLDSWKNTVQNSGSDKLTTANLLAQDAEFYYNKSLIEKQKADSSSKPYIKQNYLDNEKKYLATSVLKQQEAKNLYLSINPKLASAPLTASANQTQQTNNSVNNQSGNNSTATNNTIGNGSNTQNNSQNNNPLNSSANNTELATTTNPANNNTNQVTSFNNTGNGNNPGTANAENTTTLGQPDNNTEGNNSNVPVTNQTNSSNSSTNNGTSRQESDNNANNNITTLGQSDSNSGNTSLANNTSQQNNSTNNPNIGQSNSNTNPNNTSQTNNATTQQGNDNNANNHTTDLGQSTNNENNTVTANSNNNLANQNSNTVNSSNTATSNKTDSASSFSNNNSNQNTSTASNNTSSQGNNADSQQVGTNNQNARNAPGNNNPSPASNNTDVNKANNAGSSQLAQNNEPGINNNQQSSTTSGNSVTPENNSNPNNASALNNSSSKTDSVRNATKIDSILSSGNRTNATANNTNTNQQTQTNETGSQQNNINTTDNSTTNLTTANNTVNPVTNNQTGNTAQQTASNSANTAGQNNSENNTANPLLNNVASSNNNGTTANNAESNNASTGSNTTSNSNNTSSTQTSEANNTPDNLNTSSTGNNNVTAPITSDIFSEAATSPYSEAKPIPINPPLPEGLIFKVQVGAFRNPIAQNLFKGLQPITGEKTKTGLTRYTAGIFKEFNNAKDAQDKIHGLGFRDAFVVAFLNGKRISIAQALAMQGGNAVNIAASETQQQPTNNNTAEIQTPDNNGNAAPSTQVADVKGLFYSVQIGAFQHPVPAIKLYNLSPLFSYNAPNGYIRYNCGIYSNLPNASAAKQQIISRTPIKDAFVVAYSDGQRISITEATRLTSSGDAKLPQNPKLNILPDGSSAGGQSLPANQVTEPIPNNTNTLGAETTPSVSNNTPVTPSADTNKAVTIHAPNNTAPATSNDSTLHSSAVTPATIPPTPATTTESSMVARTISSTTVEPAGDINVSITIHRGNISGFAKLEETIPNGFTAVEGEKQNSTFKFEDGKAKYVWLSLPTDSVFTVTYKLTALSTVSGQQTVTGKFFYLENNERQVTNIGNSVITVSKSPSSENSSTGNPPVANTPMPATSDTTNKKVTFSVQVGAFSGPIPIDMANKLLKISNQGIKAHKEDNGITTYTVGEYSNYTSANLLKEELSKDGYPQSFIVAYYQGKKISLQQAQVLTNK